MIKKDKVVAKINELRKKARDLYGYSQFDAAYGEVLKALDTIEVKEIDLDEELSRLDQKIKDFLTTEEFEKDSAIYGHYWAIAKYAFLLGLEKQGEKKLEEKIANNGKIQ